MWSAAAGGTLLLAAVVNWVSYLPPLQDYGDWIYQGFLLKCLVMGKTSVVGLKHWPVPNVFSQIALAGLMVWLTPIVASRVFISLYLVVSGWVSWRISRVPGAKVDGVTWMLLVCVGIVHAPFWAGEINYQIGLCFLLLYVKLDDEEPRSPAYDCAYALLLYACHAICLGIFLMYVGFRAILRRQIWRTAASLVPVLCLLAWYVVADPRRDADPTGVVPVLGKPIEQVAYRLYVFAKLGPYQNMVLEQVGDYDRFRQLYWFGVVLNFCFAASILGFTGFWIVRSLAKGRRTAASLTAAACLAIACVNPSAQLGIGNVGERFVYPAVLFAILFSDRLLILKRVGAAMATFLVVFLAYLVVIMPRDAAGNHAPPNGAINEPGVRYHVLFWHRPFLNLEQAQAAQDSSENGRAPNHAIAFETSILQARPDAGVPH